MNFDKTAIEVHYNANAKGFYESYEALMERLESPADKDFLRQLWYSNRLMLIVSELGEAMEALRKNNFDDSPGSNGMCEELADAVIRLMDFMSVLLPVPSKAIEDKMQYNKQRPYMHGGKKS